MLCIEVGREGVRLESLINIVITFEKRKPIRIRANEGLKRRTLLDSRDPRQGSSQTSQGGDGSNRELHDDSRSKIRIFLVDGKQRCEQKQKGIHLGIHAVLISFSMTPNDYLFSPASL